MLVAGILEIVAVSPGVANAAMAADPTGQTRCVPDGDVEICTVGSGGSTGGAPIDPGTRTPPGSGSAPTGQSTPGLPGTGASPQTGESVLQQCPRGATCTYNADGQIAKCSKPGSPDVWCGPTGDPQGEALARAYRDRTDKVIADAVARHEPPVGALHRRDAPAVQRRAQSSDVEGLHLGCRPLGRHGLGSTGPSELAK